MGAQYKVGDRVRLIDASGDSTSRARVGDVGTVESLGTYDKNLLRVRMDDGHLTSRKYYRFELVQYKPVQGDRVRVVLEGEVSEVWHSGRFVLQPDNDAVDIGFGVDRVEGFNASVEKIEPGAILPDGLTISEDGSHLNWLGENYVRQQVEEPVEVFKPGDVVRYKAIPKYVYALGDDGYVNLYIGCVYKYGEPRAAHVAGDFTSRDYEKVNLG